MYRQTHAGFFRNRNDSAQEIRHVFTQLLLINIAVFRQTRAELVQRVPLFRTRQASNDIAGQLLNVRFTGGIEPFKGLLLLFSGVIRFGARAFQNVQLKRRKGNLVETQRFRAVRHLIFQVGTRPVQNRHEVIADRINAAGRQVANALLIVCNPGPVFPGMGFDIFVNRNAFYHRPG